VVTRSAKGLAAWMGRARRMRRAGRIGRVVLAGRARLAGRSAGRGGRVAGAPYRLTVKILPSARPPQPHWPLQPPGSSRWRDRAPARVSFAYRRAGHSLQYGRDHGPEVSKGGGSGPAVSKEWPAGGRGGLWQASPGAGSVGYRGSRFWWNFGHSGVCPKFHCAGRLQGRAQLGGGPHSGRACTARVEELVVTGPKPGRREARGARPMSTSLRGQDPASPSPGCHQDHTGNSTSSHRAPPTTRSGQAVRSDQSGHAQRPATGRARASARAGQVVPRRP